MAEIGWNLEREMHLRELWAEGHSTAQIGIRMGMTKNAVVGKAHRLGLPSRESPIRGDVVAARAKAAVKKALLPLPREGAGVRGRGSSAAMRGATLAVLAGVVEVPAVAEAPVVYVGRVSPCSFPLGEPKTKAFRYCDVPSVPGKSYCPEHYGIACIPRRERSEAERAADVQRSRLALERAGRGVGSFGGARWQA